MGRKKLIAFDLDDTLAVTKQPISEDMAQALLELAQFYLVCVITSSDYRIIQKNVITPLTKLTDNFEQFHFMPLGGAHYYRFTAGNWQHVRFIEDIPASERQVIIDTVTRIVKQAGEWRDDATGDIIQDRYTQITYSALGQQSAPADKYAWDPDKSKRRRLREAIITELPDYQVHINGNTSIDVSKEGNNKGVGIQKLLGALQVNNQEVLFIGDQLYDGGNDYPVKQLGIATIDVNHAEHTLCVIKGLIGAN